MIPKAFNNNPNFLEMPAFLSGIATNFHIVDTENITTLEMPAFLSGIATLQLE